MSDDLVKRLTIMASVMEMGEKIAWGSDTSIMREASARIEELEAKLAKAVSDAERRRGVLLRISKTEPHHAGQTPNEYHFQKWAREATETARTTPAELKGQDDE